MIKKTWYSVGDRRLLDTLERCRSFKGLARLGPQSPWRVDLKFVGRILMTRLNHSYRGKKYPTDILSFPALELFREQGFLGDLVICLPVLKEQAESLKHTPEIELDILLVHGVLHLLGLDHEKDAKEAVRMAKWEAKVIQGISTSFHSSGSAGRLGLIDRSRSGI